MNEQRLTGVKNRTTYVQTYVWRRIWSSATLSTAVCHRVMGSIDQRVWTRLHATFTYVREALRA